MTPEPGAVGAPRTPEDAAQHVIAATRQWLERVVLGLRLCPFAAVPFAREQIRYCVSGQTTTDGLAQELNSELAHLHTADPQLCETSLLIHPYVLTDFADYNQFLDEADTAIAALGFRGELQIASFHPDYQFAGSAPSDVQNCTNRSPYPMLHLLREASVARAVATYREIDEIGARNSATLVALGYEGWLALQAGQRATRLP
jgi:hypothetical protein